jgi:4-amino-4-deoxy-L-arabinose transferase-like glycosyltransferase
MMPGVSAADPDGRGVRWALGALLVLAALLRLVSLGVTEVEWWDSTIYLTEARRIASGISWAPAYERHRAPLLPWIGALSYGAGLDEAGLYLANVVFSVGTVWLMFRAGELLFGRRAGLVSGFLMAVSWESLFFTQRVLTESPALFFWVLSIVAYAAAVVRGRTAWLPLLGPAVALAFLAHFRAAAIVLALALHFVAAGKWTLLRRKEVLVSVALGLAGLASYAAFSARRWGAPFELLRAYQVQRLGSIGPERLGVFARYLEYLPSYLGSALFALLVAVLVVALGGAVRTLAKRREARDRTEGLHRGLLLAGLVLVPLLVPSLFEKFHHRLGILCLPGLFLVLGAAMARIEAWTRARSVVVSRALVAGALAIAAAQQLSTADDWLHAEGKSYLSVKQAGLWVGQHSRQEAAIVTTSWPQINFYAERRTFDVPGTAGEFEALVRTRNTPYLVLSAYERRPAWVEPYLEENAARLPRVYLSGDLRGLETSVYDCLQIAGDGSGR